MVSIYYLSLKQSAILRDMCRLSKNITIARRPHVIILRMLTAPRLWKLLSLYNSFSGEIDAYNPLIHRCLSIMFATWVSVMTYISYLLLWTSLPSTFKVLASVIFIGHFNTLVVTILVCSAITNCHHRVTRQIKLVCHQLQAFSRGTWFQTLKVFEFLLNENN